MVVVVKAPLFCTMDRAGAEYFLLLPPLESTLEVEEAGDTVVCCACAALGVDATSGGPNQVKVAQPPPPPGTSFIESNVAREM